MAKTNPATMHAAASSPNGAAVAAALAAMLSIVAMGLLVTGVVAFPALKPQLIAIGRILPVVGPTASGPYAGQQVVMLCVWLGGWALLHALLRNRRVAGGGWFAWTLAGVGLGTLLVWPPFFNFLLGK